MMLKMKRALFPSVLFTVGALALACGGGGGDKETGGGTMGGTMGGTAGGGDGGGGNVNWVGQTVDATDPTTIIAGIKVSVLDNVTVAAVSPAIEATSGSDGKFTISVPSDKNFGIKAFAAQQHTDTYSFNVKPGEKNADLRLVRMGSESAATLVPASAGYTNDANKAPIAGAVYWKTPSQAEYGVVGCAKIEGEGEDLEMEDLRYFKGALPSSVADRPLANGTNPMNGKFFIGNVNPGPHTIIAKVNGTEIGRTTLPVFARKDASSQVSGVGANLFLSGIYIDAPAGATNPTPAGCN